MDTELIIEAEAEALVVDLNKEVDEKIFVWKDDAPPTLHYGGQPFGRGGGMPRFSPKNGADSALRPAKLS